MKIHRPTTLEEASFNSIIYGMTNSGKTTLLSSANDCERTKPCLFVNVDGGMLSIAGKKISVVSPQNFGELQEIYEYLLNDNKKYRSVALDSLTATQTDISMDSLIGAVDERRAYSDLSEGKAPTQQNWLQSGLQMKKVIHAFRDLSYLPDPEKRLHVFMSASERMDEKRSIVCPALPGILGLQCGGYVDALLRMSEELVEGEDGKTKEVHVLYARKFMDSDGNLCLAKNRLNMLGRRMVNPTVDSIMKKWRAA